VEKVDFKLQILHGDADLYVSRTNMMVDHEDFEKASETDGPYTETVSFERSEDLA
jgi:hypothetical protein